MKHVVALVLKYGMTTLVMILASYLFMPINFGQLLIVASGITLLAYIVGDLIILPKSNNTIATISDFALAYVTIFMFNYILPGINLSLFFALMASTFIAMGEWIFHKYMSGKVLSRS